MPPTHAEEIAGSLAAIETKLDSIATQIDTLFDKHEKTEARVRSLETWRGWILGGMAAWGIVVPVLIAMVLRK